MNGMGIFEGTDPGVRGAGELFIAAVMEKDEVVSNELLEMLFLRTKARLWYVHSAQ